MDLAYTVSSTRYYVDGKPLKEIKSAHAETLLSDDRVDRVSVRYDSNVPGN